MGRCATMGSYPVGGLKVGKELDTDNHNRADSAQTGQPFGMVSGHSGR